VKQEHDNRNL